MIGLIYRALTSRYAQRFVDQNRLARSLGKLADSRRLPKFLLKFIVRAYIRHFNIPMDEFECDLNTIKSFNHFFIRPLKPGRRIYGEGIVSPVDGCITQYGVMTQGRLLQVKGSNFTLNDVVGEKPGFDRGCYAIIYLSPGDYHRFHAPFTGRLTKIRYVPGQLLATNAAALHKEDGVYCRNERIVLHGNSPWGEFYYVAVGATAVGRITLNTVQLQTNQRRACEVVVRDNLSTTIEQGEELGYFELGSTVILMVNNDGLTAKQWVEGKSIKLGETLWT